MKHLGVGTPVILIFMAVFLAACSIAQTEALPSTEAPPSSAGPHPGALMARDAALAHVEALIEPVGPGPTAGWAAENITQPDILGLESYAFTSGDWLVAVSYPLVAPDDMVYTVEIINPVVEFRWKGTVTADGEVRTAEP